MADPLGTHLGLERMADPLGTHLGLADLGEPGEDHVGFTMPPMPQMPNIAFTHEEILREVRELRDKVEELERGLLGVNDEEGAPEEEPLYGSDGVKRSPGF